MMRDNPVCTRGQKCPVGNISAAGTDEVKKQAEWHSTPFYRVHKGVHNRKAHY